MTFLNNYIIYAEKSVIHTGAINKSALQLRFSSNANNIILVAPCNFRFLGEGR